MKWLIATFLVVSSTAIADHNWDNRDITAGRNLYTANCASCHGVNLEGQPDWRLQNEDGVFPAPPHDGAGHTWHHDDALLFEYTKFGGKGALEIRGITEIKSGMPAFGETLADGEVWNILAFIRSTWSPREQEAQARRNPPH